MKFLSEDTIPANMGFVSSGDLDEVPMRSKLEKMKLLASGWVSRTSIQLD
jgi:hypothetical protein